MKSAGIGKVFFFFALVSPCAALAGTHYEPAQPLTSPCPCSSINGTCASDGCSITCANGFTNCDNDLTNGCECGSATTDSCKAASCTGTTCQVTINQGAACSQDCMLDGTCDSTGACVGTPAPDNTPCAANCGGASGVCSNGACTCPSGSPDLSVGGGPPDMGMGGNNTGGCGCTLAPVAGGSSLFLLVAFGMLALALRRRRG